MRITLRTFLLREGTVDNYVIYYLVLQCSLFLYYVVILFTRVYVHQQSKNARFVHDVG